MILVRSPDHRRVALSSVLVAAHDPDSATGKGDRAALSLRVGGGEPSRFEARAGERFAVETDLKQGWNVLIIESEAGNFRPVDFEPATGDMRELGFALGPIDLGSR